MSYLLEKIDDDCLQDIRTQKTTITKKLINHPFPDRNIHQVSDNTSLHMQLEAITEYSVLYYGLSI